MSRQGLLIVISGPSGAGKGTLCNIIKRDFPDIFSSISATTRNPRRGEKNGVDYLFVSEEEFLKAKDENDFLEWARVYGNYYGTPKKIVQEKLEQGIDVILEIDIQGALQIKKRYPQGIFIFIVPPSMQELKKRIESRGKDSPQDILKRLSCADKELSYVSEYDYIVVNDQLDKASEKLKSIINAQRCRPYREKINFT